MEIAETMTGDAKVATLNGRLDAATSATAEERLLAMLTGGAKLIADMTEVHYVSSAGLRVLLKAAKQAKAVGASFALVALQAPVREVLLISGFDRILQIHPTRDAAVSAWLNRDTAASARP